MEPLQLAALADSKSYFTTGSPRLNRRCERWPIAKCKNLTVRGLHAARGLAEAKKGNRRKQSPADQFDLCAAFIAPFAASAVIGNEHTRAPQGSKMALPSAGAITVIAGSPTPVAFSPLARR
jgi:hypothetical protein